MNAPTPDNQREMLKPCPFCGGEGQIDHSYREDNDRYPRDFWHVRASCSSCEVSPTDWVLYGNQEQRVANFHVKQEAENWAITAWNARIPDPRVAEWRSIDSAPKDGTDLLLFFPLEGLDHRHHAQRVICCWRENKAYPALSGWVFQGRAVRSYSDGFEPTHWMLLPDLPARQVLKPSEGGE